MTDLFPLSITPDEAVFLYRSIRLTFTVSEKSRLLTAVFDNDPTRPHTVADWLHAEKIRDLLVYFGFNSRGTVTVERRGGRIEFRQKLIRELCADNSTRSEKLEQKAQSLASLCGTVFLPIKLRSAAYALGLFHIIFRKKLALSP